MKKASHFHVNEADLLCKNRCGFYGNSLWKGYCSICYKSLPRLGLEGSSQPAKVPLRKLEVSPTANQNFAKFEEKRKIQSDRRSLTVKSIFRKTPSKQLGHKVPPAENHEASNVPTQQRPQVSEFSHFLQSLSDGVYHDVMSRVNTLITRFKTLPPHSTVDVCSDLVQDFYQMMSDHIVSSPIYRDLDEKTVNELTDRLEVNIMNRFYNAVFCPVTSNDEEQDLVLQRRVKSLHWVTIEQLEANISENDLGVRSALEKAISDIIELDTKRAPKEKLACIVNCSRSIFEALRLTSASQGQSSVASADDFLPVFIFIVLKANPPRLRSNINYVTRFSFPSRLNSGEGGYYFTNLCCVVDFVEKLNAESLNLSSQDFEAYMKGEATPNGTSNVYMCDGLRVLHENLQLLEKVKRHQMDNLRTAEQLQDRLTAFRQQFDLEINDLVKSTPLLLKVKCAPVDLDSQDDLPSSLPAPLMPQSPPR